MKRSNAGLDALRTSLLAACGLAAGACTSAERPATDDAPTKDSAKDSTQLETPKPRTPAPTQTACRNPTPVLVDDKDSGYVECEDGAVNRARALQCANPVMGPACDGTQTKLECKTHADCTDKPRGFCMSGVGQIGSYCDCVYPCLDDSECAADQACMCPGVAEKYGPSFARCAPADCKIDADCPSGECGPSYYFNGCELQLAMKCRAGTDKCRSDAECNGSSCVSQVEDEGLSAFWCEGMSCKIGRPLTVEGGVRVAGLSHRRWGPVRVEGLSAARSDGRAAHWLAIARMEHASVASFARFVQELMIFAAPPELLRDALAAAADEVRHAEQTFALASAYAGAPVGPGALRIDDLCPSPDLESFVTRLIEEGCVGETLGVAEALALLDLELAPALRPRLEQIAADETRHAALAWRSLRWIATRVSPRLVERVFARSIAQVEHVHDEADDPTHGLLGRAAKQRTRARAIAEVIEPCRRALLEPMNRPERTSGSRH